MRIPPRPSVLPALTEEWCLAKSWLRPPNSDPTRSPRDHKQTQHKNRLWQRPGRRPGTKQWRWGRSVRPFDRCCKQPQGRLHLFEPSRRDWFSIRVSAPAARCPALVKSGIFEIVEKDGLTTVDCQSIGYLQDP